MTTQEIDAEEYLDIIKDPFTFIRVGWPDVVIYKKQAEIIESVLENDETVVHAGNMLGKDFITALIVVWFFSSRQPCKMVTLAPSESQLETVLWGEIRKFIRECRLPLPIKYNHLDCKQFMADGSLEPQSRLLGICTNKVENVQGQHLPRGPGGEPSTMAIIDEASGVDSKFYEGMDTWSHKRLIIGNPLPCGNFFFSAVERGDVPRDHGGGYDVKVIRVSVEDSPNVMLGKAQKAAGITPTNEILVPGIITYNDYCKRRKLWDPIRQCVGLDGLFYKGAELFLFPATWLAHSENLKPPASRKARAMGVDAAEGGDATVWTIVDEFGIIFQLSLSTVNTADIPNRTIALIQKYQVPSENVLFDIGGGGKQHVDQLRERGYDARPIAFGSSPTPVDTMDGKIVDQTKEEIVEVRQTYKNKRAQMYGDLRLLMNPQLDAQFCIPSKYKETHRQLAPLPLMYDQEGRMVLPPKDKPSENFKGITIKGLIGRSPDEADSLVLAVHGMLYPAEELVAGTLF